MIHTIFGFLAFASTPNPAEIKESALAAKFEQRFGNMSTLNDVVSDSEKFPTENGTWRVSSVTPEITRTQTWNLSGASKLGPSWGDGFPMVGGVFAQLPSGGTSRISIPSPFAFTALRYPSSDGDFMGSLCLRKSVLGDRLSLGIGHKFIFAAAAAASQARLGQAPTGRMELSTGPTGSWFFGISSTHGQSTISLLYAQKSLVRVTQTTTAEIPLSPGISASQKVNLAATTHWAPESIRVSNTERLGLLLFQASLTWENWRDFEPPFLKIVSGDTQSQNPDTEMRNTINPELKLSLPFQKHTGSITYAFKPSPLLDISLQGEANLLDTDIHAVTLAYQYQVSETFSVGTTIAFDYLTPRTVTKRQNDVPGSPGFVISGQVWRAAASLVLSL